jgi:hypothetical protein
MLAGPKVFLKVDYEPRNSQYSAERPVHWLCTGKEVTA